MKKTVLIYCAAVAVVLLCLIGILLLPLLGRMDFEESREMSLTFLEENRQALEAGCAELMEKQTGGLVAEHACSWQEDPEGHEYVSVDVDAQGMMGGQYWGLYYCPEETMTGDGYLPDWTALPMAVELDGSVFIRESLGQGWYFWYDDYDGMTRLP